jgi:hypothetical protein
MKRRAILTGGAFGIMMIAVPAFAQQAGSWDGTWSGSTERGGSVLITISGNKASYAFRGQPVNVTGAQASGNSFTINVNGGIPGTVRLTKGKGQTAAYAYSDTGGGSAKATLSRR